MRSGIERNVVVTLWDWGTETDGRTDSAASDVRDATVNANGRVYGVVQPSDILAVLDPVEHQATNIKIRSTAPRICRSLLSIGFCSHEKIKKLKAGRKIFRNGGTFISKAERTSAGKINAAALQFYGCFGRQKQGSRRLAKRRAAASAVGLKSGSGGCI